MSGENEGFDVASMAAELTGSTGISETVDDGEALPGHVADAVDEFDQHQAEKDLRVSNDVEDTEAAEAEREAQRGKKQLVPLGALQEERQKRQALQLELETHRQQMVALQAQQAQWQQYQQQLQQQAEAEAVPDFDTDPRAYIEHKEKQFAQALDNLQNQQAQQQAAARFQQEVATIAPIVTQAENEFREANPSYDDAFAFVQQDVEQALRARHPGASESDMQTWRTVALIEFNKGCLSRGINPAERIFGRAQELGFNPGHRVPASQGYQATAPRRQANTSLGALEGAARAPDEQGKMTAARVTEMSDAEFDDFFNGMAKNSRDRIKV